MAAAVEFSAFVEHYILAVICFMNTVLSILVKILLMCTFSVNKLLV